MTLVRSQIRQSSPGSFSDASVEDKDVQSLVASSRDSCSPESRSDVFSSGPIQSDDVVHDVSLANTTKGFHDCFRVQPTIASPGEVGL